MSAESILSALKITMWRYLMAHRPILNDKQRNTLFSIPTREHELLQYYVLSNEDIFHINTKRKVSNRPRVEEDPKMLIWILELLWSTNLHVSCP